MKMFPMFLKMENRQVVIVGGGEQAAQKCRLMLKAEARITVVADRLEPELHGYFNERRIDLRAVEQPGDVFEEAALVFVATGCKGADAAWAQIAKDARAVVNVVDYPELCDAYTPSIVDRDPVVVAIGTEGTAPVLGRQIKTRIEKMLEPRLGHFARICGSLRGAVAQHLPADQRRVFWRWVFDGPARRLFAKGREREAIVMLKSVIAQASPPAQTARGQSYVMAANASKPDLISLRDVRHLQEADVIYYDDARLSSILEYARRDAVRHKISFSDTRNLLADQALAQTAQEATARGENVVIIQQRSAAENVVDLGARRVASRA